MVALDNRNHVIGGVLCQDYSGSHLHFGFIVGLGCNLTMGKEDLDQINRNGKGHY